MPYTTANAALLENLVATRALTQLNRAVVYPRTAVVSYEPGAFERGESVKIRRPKRRVAADVDPRGAGLTVTEGTFFSGNLTLERLWGDGFPVYSNDPSDALERYVAETAGQMADAIATPNDDYMYSVFRNWSATTGNVAIGDHPPLAIVASTDSNNTGYDDFKHQQLLRAGVVMDTFNVPYTDRFAVISSTAKGAFLGDSIAVNGFAAALNIGSGTLIQTGLPNAQFIERSGFQVAGSNTVTGQTGVNMLANAASGVVSASAANTAFTYADNQATTFIGAVNVTLTATSTTIGGSVGVGQIARIQATSGGAIVAHGVILRIDTTTATAPIITLVPYAPDGALLSAAQITTSMSMVIPTIPSINTAHHREGMLMATRQLRVPSEFSGARATTVRDPQTNLLLQIFTGQYDITKLRELQAYYMLCGAKFSDSRKGVLILSK